MKRSCLVLFSAIFAVLAHSSHANADQVRLGSTGAVAALLQRLAETYAARAPEHQPEVIPGLGSGGAISAVAAGALDLAISSRDLNDKERAQGLVSTRLFETPYVFVSSIKVPLSLTPDDILGYYSGASRTYPNGDAVRLVLRPRHDANTVFVTGAIPGMTAAQEKARLRHDIPVAGTDQDNMQYMKNVPGAFSGMSLTQLAMEPNSLQRVRLNGIEATLETIRSGAYPYKIGMFVVTTKSPGSSARAFHDFLTSPEGRKIITEAGGQLIAP